MQVCRDAWTRVLTFLDPCLVVHVVLGVSKALRKVLEHVMLDLRSCDVAVESVMHIRHRVVGLQCLEGNALPDDMPLKHLVLTKHHDGMLLPRGWKLQTLEIPCVVSLPHLSSLTALTMSPCRIPAMVDATLLPPSLRTLKLSSYQTSAVLNLRHLISLHHLVLDGVATVESLLLAANLDTCKLLWLPALRSVHGAAVTSMTVRECPVFASCCMLLGTLDTDQVTIPLELLPTLQGLTFDGVPRNMQSFRSLRRLDLVLWLSEIQTRLQVPALPPSLVHLRLSTRCNFWRRAVGLNVRTLANLPLETLDLDLTWVSLERVAWSRLSANHLRLRCGGVVPLRAVQSSVWAHAVFMNLQSIPEEVDVFSRCQKLEKLKLWGGGVFACPLPANLLRLHFVNYCIRVPPASVTRLRSLKFEHCTSPFFSSLDLAALSPHLEKLHITECGSIRFVSPQDVRWLRLARLTLSEGFLADNVASAFRHAPSLADLRLSDPECLDTLDLLRAYAATLVTLRVRTSFHVALDALTDLHALRWLVLDCWNIEKQDLVDVVAAMRPAARLHITSRFELKLTGNDEIVVREVLRIFF